MDNVDISISTDLRALNRKLDALQAQTAALGSAVAGLGTMAKSTQEELARLRQDFNNMINEQRRTAALQQAQTELVAVRQEMERKFGNYRIVRNSMIGILQATDAALVKKTTIANISEELMISTHDYWLAPVMVAVAAWIGNNRDLADRAIKEAVKRDPEHTALVMALICRRNNRIQTCYEWLSRYFQTQNAASMDEDSMVYIDAYINGIFGPDEKHMCDDYITRWINEIRGRDSDFEEEQASTWKEYFTKYNADEAAKYPALSKCAKEFGYIDSYLARVDAAGPIAENFRQINGAFVDQEALRKQVDEKLVTLVNSDDKAERSLRHKEEYLMAVKACQGDVDRARQMVNSRNEEEKKKRMDIISHFTRVIKDENKDRKISSSEKKTAVSFLRGYINRGFNKYMTEKRAQFPTGITLNINGWQGETSDGSNTEALKQNYRSYIAGLNQQEKAQLDEKYNPRSMIIGAIICAVIGIILCFVNIAVGVAAIIVALVVFIAGMSKKKNREAARMNCQEKYQQMEAEGLKAIDDCVNEWSRARNAVLQYQSNELKEIA